MNTICVPSHQLKDKEKSGLIVIRVVPIDQCYLPGMGIKDVIQFVGDHRSGGSGSEIDDLLFYSCWVLIL